MRQRRFQCFGRLRRDEEGRIPKWLEEMEVEGKWKAAEGQAKLGEL